MTRIALLLLTLALCLVTFPALAQEVDPGAVETVSEAFSKFQTGAWLLGLAIVARILTTIVKGFQPLWDLTKDKPHLKWIYPATIALLGSLATAPFITNNWIVVLIVSVVAAALSGFTAVGWYHGPTWIGGDPNKHSSGGNEP